MNKDFLAGWHAARVCYQNTGGVPPYPPGYEAPVEGAPEPKAPPVKKAAKKQKED